MGRPKGSWTKTANPRYKGGRYATAAGYVFVYHPEHANADKRGYVREHVLVMSASMGRPIVRGEIVHHINGNTGDNRLENLELTTPGRHATIHHKGIVKPASIQNLKRMTSERQKRIWDSGAKDHLRAQPKTCDQCGAQFVKERLLGRSGHKHQFCNRACFQAFRKSNAKQS